MEQARTGGMRGSSKRGCTRAAGKQKVELKRCKERDNTLTVGTTFLQLSLDEGHCAGKRLWREILACCHPEGRCLWRQEDPTRAGGMPVSHNGPGCSRDENSWKSPPKPVWLVPVCTPAPVAAPVA